MLMSSMHELMLG